MLTIRLQRTGTKNAANYRIVVAEKSAHVSKKFHEVLGTYNPRSKDFVIKNPERLEYWISQHVGISPTVNNLLVDKGMHKGTKVKAFNIPKKAEVKVDEKSAGSAPVAEAVTEPVSEPKPEVTPETAPTEAEKPDEQTTEPS